MATILVLLDRAWHLNATGAHKTQGEIACHLVAAAVAIAKAQRCRRV